MDRHADGPYFDFDREVCVRGAMNREHFDDNGSSRCAGEKSAHADPEMPISDDDPTWHKKPRSE